VSITSVLAVFTWTTLKILHVILHVITRQVHSATARPATIFKPQAVPMSMMTA